MKRLNRVLFAATLGLGLASAGQALAQSQLSGPNGTAMSPKDRFWLVEQPARGLVMTAQPSTVWPSGVNTAQVAASPKQQQLQAQLQVGQPVPHATALVSYQPTGPDGITASPKLRQMMEENTAQFQVAPLK